MMEITAKPLSGKKGLVLGIANEHSIAYGCAQAFRALGAELAITYANDKTKRYVEPLAQELEAPIFLPCDVREKVQFEAVFQAIGQSWGELDFALHAIAFARPRQGRARERGCATRQSAPSGASGLSASWYRESALRRKRQASQRGLRLPRIHANCPQDCSNRRFAITPGQFPPGEGAQQLNHYPDNNLQAERRRNAAAQAFRQLAQIFEQMAASNLAAPRCCRRHPYQNIRPARIGERLVDEAATTECDSGRGLAQREPPRLQQIVDRLDELIRHGGSQRLKIVEMGVKSSFRYPRFFHNFVHSDRFHSLSGEQRVGGRHQLGTSPCPLFAADFGSADRIESGHGATVSQCSLPI
jgi:hypothetical protein